MIDENGVMTIDDPAFPTYQDDIVMEESAPGGTGFENNTYGSNSTSSLYTKDPTKVAPSEYSFLGGIANLLKAGAPIGVQALSKNAPASATPLQQLLFPKAGSNAADPQPMKAMSPILKAGLIVGGIVVVTAVLFFFVKKV